MYIWQHDLKTLSKYPKLSFGPFTAFLLREDFGARRGEADAFVIVVLDDGLDDIVREVECPCRFSFWVAHKNIVSRKICLHMQAFAKKG